MEQEPQNKEPHEESAGQDEQPETISVSKQDWDKLQGQVKELNDKNLRVLAESENTRKRLQKEKTEMQGYAKENLACEFLTPIDQFATALGFKEQQSAEIQNWMTGFEMILNQFKDVLAQNEIRPIEALGKTFDPFYHEAMESEETDQTPPNTIMQEYVKGYMMGERVIRPAKVKVAKAPKTEESSEQDKQENLDKMIHKKEG